MNLPLNNSANSLAEMVKVANYKSTKLWQV